MAEPREPSHPPSDPRPSVVRAGAGRFPAEERSGPRVPFIVATLLGLVLVASGLFLWRRPHAPDAAAEAAAASASALALDESRAPLAASDGGAAPSLVTVSEARVLGCHDKGTHKTPAEQCDHVVAFEQALSKAIEQTAACSGAGANEGRETPGGGTIEYVADVSFSRRKVKIHLPRAGRSLHERKVVTACATAVREAMQSVPLDGEDHQHARYQISVTATYRGKTSG